MSKIKVRVRGGKRGGLVVVERVPLTAVKDNRTKVNFGGQVVTVQRSKGCRIYDVV
jgi:hypothetical protein